MSKKILFTGYYGFNNFGDDLFGLACINGLKKSGSNYMPIILSPPVSGIDTKYLVPKMLSRIYKDNGFIGKILRMLFMVYGCLRCRDVVLGGGSVISSYGSSRTRFIQYCLAKLNICSLSAIGVSIGPFSSEKDRSRAKKFINCLSYLTVRDAASVTECDDLGVDIDVHLFNDLAGCASLPLPDKNKNKSRTIGVSICEFESIVGGNDEDERLRNIVIFEGISAFSVKHDFKVSILILNSHEMVGDVGVSQKLYDYLSSNGVSAELIEYVNPFESLKDISDCEIFFSVRLHGAISAYLLKVPFLLVEYHRKCKDFLDYIGFEKENRILATVVDKEIIVEKLERVINERNLHIVEPEEYAEKSSRIFMESSWLT